MNRRARPANPSERSRTPTEWISRSTARIVHETATPEGRSRRSRGCVAPCLHEMMEAGLAMREAASRSSTNAADTQSRGADRGSPPCGLGCVDDPRGRSGRGSRFQLAGPRTGVGDARRRVSFRRASDGQRPLAATIGIPPLGSFSYARATSLTPELSTLLLRIAGWGAPSGVGVSWTIWIGRLQSMWPLRADWPETAPA